MPKTKHADDVPFKAAPYRRKPFDRRPSSHIHHGQRPAEKANPYAAENPYDLLTILEFTKIEMLMAADTQDPPTFIIV